jgi:hypothetical protein
MLLTLLALQLLPGGQEALLELLPPAVFFL